MTDELRAAAERFKTEKYDTWDDPQEYFMSEQKMDDLILLSDAYLTELTSREAQEADDVKLVKEDTSWMETVGFGPIPPAAVGPVWWDRGRVTYTDDVLFLSGATSTSFIVAGEPTRGQVRNLCKAIGHPLEEA